MSHAIYQQKNLSHTGHIGYTDFARQTSTDQAGTIFTYSITQQSTTAPCGHKQQPTPKTYTLTAMPSSHQMFQPRQNGAKLDGSVLYRKARAKVLQPRHRRFQFRPLPGYKLSLLLGWDGLSFSVAVSGAEEVQGAEAHND